MIDTSLPELFKPTQDPKICFDLKRYNFWLFLKIVISPLRPGTCWQMERMKPVKGVDHNLYYSFTFAQKPRFDEKANAKELI